MGSGSVLVKFYSWRSITFVLTCTYPDETCDFREAVGYIRRAQDSEGSDLILRYLSATSDLGNPGKTT